MDPIQGYQLIFFGLTDRSASQEGMNGTKPGGLFTKLTYAFNVSFVNFIL